MRTRALLVALLGALAAVSSATAGAPPTARSCPSATVVNATLGQHGSAPTVTKTAYSKTCTYKASSALGVTQITFQEDTAAQFAADEKSAARFGMKIFPVHGLGKAAWAAGPGDLYVFDGTVQIKLLAPFLSISAPKTATAKLEVLARKLL